MVNRMKCPWTCGWEGKTELYIKHLEKCPKYPGAKKILAHEEKVYEFLEEEVAKVKAGEEKLEVEEEKKKHSKVFKSWEEFLDWLAKQGITAEPRPHTGLYKDDKRVGAYFETSEGIRVDLVEDAETWLIRDKVFVEVEGKVEEPLQTPVEADKK